MKKLFRFYVVFIIVALILLTGCSNAKKFPSKVVKVAYMAANAGKYAEANDSLCRETLMLVKILGEKEVWDRATRDRTITKIEILEEKVIGQEYTFVCILKMAVMKTMRRF